VNDDKEKKNVFEYKQYIQNTNININSNTDDKNEKKAVVVTQKKPSIKPSTNPSIKKTGGNISNKKILKYY
jgi:hypothetical protein